MNYIPPPYAEHCIEAAAAQYHVTAASILSTIQASLNDPNFGVIDGSSQTDGHLIKIPDEWLTILPSYGLTADEIGSNDCADIQAGALILSFNSQAISIKNQMQNWTYGSMPRRLMDRARQFITIIQHAAVTYSVPAALIEAIAAQESGFYPNVVSPKGAIGLMQLMPDTASGLGVNPYDVTQNIMGGTALIGSLLVKYNGSLSLALAAYNAGSGNVDKFGGVPPFPETQNYVPSVEGKFHQFSNQN